MTNEEASCVLHCPDAYGGIYGQKYGAALAHCFELLKQQPCEDAVSRQAVLDACDQSINIFDATDRIKELPSVTPQYTDEEQQKKGHWEKVNTAREYNSDAYECSECKYIIWTYKDADRKWNYCPNCGCRMVDVPDIDVGKMEVEE